MKKGKENTFLWIALAWILISVLSMFVSVVSYTTPGGKETVYAVQDLIDGETFSREVLYQYSGRFHFNIGTWALTALCILGAGAIAAALAGILIMSKQKPVKWPYAMTVVGVIGTLIPAILILYATVISANHFPGKILPGFYPIVTPIAVVLCLWFVGKERKRVLQANASVKKNRYIHTAGDLK